MWFSRIPKLLHKTWHAFLIFHEFIRFAAFGFTVMLPLLGAASVARHLSIAQMLGLIIVALNFHSFSFVFNDVIDLPIDRTQSLRTQSPLVQGIIRPWQALIFAVLQIPVALLITFWLGGNGWAYFTLGTGFLLMAVYDVWGKRMVVPFVTDVIQGGGWAMLVLYGASVAGEELNPLALELFSFMVVYVIMINGVHASLRDLANDLKWGMRSTAILFGARPHHATQVNVPRRLAVYAYALQALLIGLLLLPLIQNHFGYAPIVWLATLIVILLLSVRCLRLLAIITSSDSQHNEVARAIGAYLFASLSGPVVLFALYIDPAMLIVLLIVAAAPLLPNKIQHLRKMQTSIHDRDARGVRLHQPQE